MCYFINNLLTSSALMPRNGRKVTLTVVMMQNAENGEDGQPSLNVKDQAKTVTAKLETDSAQILLAK